VTDLPVERIVAEYECGLNSTQLAKKYFVSKGTILRHLHKNGVKMRRPKNINWAQIPPEELRRLYGQGASLSKLAKKYRVGRRTILRHLERLGIYVKPPPPKSLKLTDDHVKPLAGLDYAPMRGKSTKGCMICKKHDECRRRQLQDLWPLCCIPTRLEVALAYRDGRIGHDDNMPEWLPDLVQELTP